ncbi:hypothetical protein Gpo141_00011004 [Globisporangium polare]
MPSVQVKPHASSSAVVPHAPPTMAMTGKVPSIRSATKARGPSVPENDGHGEDEGYKPGKWDIWMLGITIVIGGQYFSWNAGFTAGLYSYMLAYFLTGSAYITLCCCTSEITGALPFAGGAYGLSRCTLGFYPAFMIGCCEALEYIVYVSSSVLSLVDMVVLIVPVLDPVRPLVWAAFYISALFFHLKSDRVFWIFNAVIGFASIAIVVLFCFGGLPYVSFAKYAHDPNMQFVGGFAGFMKALPLAPWFFVGVEALSLSSDQVAHPKLMVPFAQVTCAVTLFVTGVMVFFVAVSLPPGIAELPANTVPFNNCFTLLFNISNELATVLSLPATYATAFGFMWCYGKLIAAMATSRLLPPFLAKTLHGREGAPYIAITFGSALSYSLCLLVYLVPTISAYLYIICITCGFMSYIGQCVGYIALKRSYKNIKSSSFRNPFGIPGAIYSMSVWALSLLAVVAYQGNGGVEILAFCCMAAALTVFYFAYARKRQTFSAQENKILLVAHVMKFNGQRAAAKHPHKNRGSGGTTGGTASKRSNQTAGGASDRFTNNPSVHENTTMVTPVTNMTAAVAPSRG